MGKSDLKHVVFHSDAFISARKCVPYAWNVAREADVPIHDRDTVRYVFEDASVRFSAGGFAREQHHTGLHAIETFLSPIHEAMQLFPHLFAYVVAFDKKSHVPQAKAPTQAKRRAALTQAGWVYDGVSSVISDAEAIPPWKDVRANKAAYGRAVWDIVQGIQRRVRVPRGTCVIIDAEVAPFTADVSIAGPIVIRNVFDVPAVAETYEVVAPCTMETCTGLHCECAEFTVASRDVTLANRVGEADLMAQLYANWCTVRAPEGSVLHNKQGTILVRTVDTDYFPLTIFHASQQQQTRHDVLLHIGHGYMDATLTHFVKKDTSGAIKVHEVYSVRKLVNIVASLHGDDVAVPNACASFVAWCAACGNDYVSKLHGLGHAVLYDAYVTLVSKYKRILVVNIEDYGWLLQPGAFAAFVSLAYAYKCHLRLPNVEHHVQQQYSLQKLRDMMNDPFSPAAATSRIIEVDDMIDYMQSIQWSLYYCSMLR